jgi:hypothetical protein
MIQLNNSGVLLFTNTQDSMLAYKCQQITIIVQQFQRRQKTCNVQTNPKASSKIAFHFSYILVIYYTSFI